MRSGPVATISLDTRLDILLNATTLRKCVLMTELVCCCNAIFVWVSGKKPRSTMIYTIQSCTCILLHKNYRVGHNHEQIPRCISFYQETHSKSSHANTILCMVHLKATKFKASVPPVIKKECRTAIFCLPMHAYCQTIQVKTAIHAPYMLPT